jgi:hypothetical protein
MQTISFIGSDITKRLRYVKRIKKNTHTHTHTHTDEGVQMSHESSKVREVISLRKHVAYESYKVS